MEGATPEVIREILQFREENEQGMSNIGQNPSGESFLVSALFHGFPQVSESSLPIIISSCENTRKLHMEVGWVWETFDDDGNSRLVQEERAFVGEHDTIPALVVHTENRRRVYPIDRINRLTSNRRSSARNDPTLTESIFVSSSGAERTEMLGPLWDNISLTEREQYVVEALQIIDPKISAVSMVGAAFCSHFQDRSSSVRELPTTGTAPLFRGRNESPIRHSLILGKRPWWDASD